VACVEGKYKPTNGSDECTRCVPGKFSSATAAAAEATCSACPAHTYSGSGSSNASHCTCNLGYTGPDGSACQACIAGTYKVV